MFDNNRLFVLYIISCSVEMHGDFTNFEDLHAIAGALKLYFRELPIPLITFDNYDLALIAASELKNRF